MLTTNKINIKGQTNLVMIIDGTTILCNYHGRVTILLNNRTVLDYIASQGLIASHTLHITTDTSLSELSTFFKANGIFIYSEVVDYLIDQNMIL